MTTSHPTKPLQVWCLLRDQFGHVKPVEEYLGERAVFEYDASWDPRRMAAAAPDVMVCVNDVHYDVCRCLDAARAVGIPSIVLQDGVLEWRCQYENPRLGAGGGAPQHQPVVADKIACIGPSSARHIASWGNQDKVEVTGMPRLDYLFASKPTERRVPGSRLLVMTAKKPGFTEEQTRITARSLTDLKKHLDALDGIDVTWRLTKNLAVRVGVENRLTSLDGGELAEELRRVDGVITTPSTAMLEAMILGRPVGCLDYHNAPRFVPTAWTISAREHIGGVVAELLGPSTAKMAFQQECLRDALLCEGPASARVAKLIEKVATGARQTKRNGTPQYGMSRTKESPNGHSAVRFPALGSLYPETPVFQETDVRSLQARLARAESEHARLAREQSERGIGYWVQALGRATARRLRTAYGGSEL